MKKSTAIWFALGTVAVAGGGYMIYRYLKKQQQVSRIKTVVATADVDAFNPLNDQGERARMVMENFRANLPTAFKIMET